MKSFLTASVFLLFQSFCHGNYLLQNPQTGKPFSTGKVSDIAIAANGSEVALIIANNTTGKLYAIDIQDNNPADAALNAVTVIVGVTAKLSSALGVNVTVKNYEVNPITKSIYVLAEDASQNTYLAVMKKNGTEISALDLENVSYCSIIFSTSGAEINDITWGDDTLYVSTSYWNLASEVVSVAAPFAHNGTVTSKVVSRFSGNGYSTQAPLQTMEFMDINGEKRLVGVTTCAPGYSMKVSELKNTGMVQVTEDFNINTDSPLKVVGMFVDNKHYLFDIHRDLWLPSGGQILRIGEKYLDGSQIPLGKYNANSTTLREPGAFGWERASGLTEEDLKIYSGAYQLIARYSDHQLLTLSTSHVMRLMAVGSPVGIREREMPVMSVYPNPATSSINIKLIRDCRSAKIQIHSLDGKEVISREIGYGENRLDVSTLPKGAYLLSLSSGAELIRKEKILIR
jgi:hypothetical protein